MSIKSHLQPFVGPMNEQNVLLVNSLKISFLWSSSTKVGLTIFHGVITEWLQNSNGANNFVIWIFASEYAKKYSLVCVCLFVCRSSGYELWKQVETPHSCSCFPMSLLRLLSDCYNTGEEGRLGLSSYRQPAYITQLFQDWKLYIYIPQFNWPGWPGVLQSPSLTWQSDHWPVHQSTMGVIVSRDIQLPLHLGVILKSRGVSSKTREPGRQEGVWKYW